MSKDSVSSNRKSKILDASSLFAHFRGDDPEYAESIEIPDIDTAFVIGHLDGILYTTIRDGEEEKYVHEFKKKSRPLLASSHDGRHLIILGGEYDFTELGIVDK